MARKITMGHLYDEVVSESNKCHRGDWAVKIRIAGVTGCSSVWYQSVAFGSRKSQVRILSPGL